METIKIFKYIKQLDCFVVNPEYKKIADNIGLTEWNDVVWIGRYFNLDNDRGEHWFDNWDLRERLEQEGKNMGIEPEDLLIIDPSRFKDGSDGPCHTDNERRQFWMDVLKSLELSFDTIFSEARKFNSERKADDSEYISNLEERIKEIRNSFVAR